MRWLTSLVVLLLGIACSVLAHDASTPLRGRTPPNRLSLQDEDQHSPPVVHAVSSSEGSTVDYLVTFSRTITTKSKENVLDVLLQHGAVVKQIYDYRVYKGVLFRVVSVQDNGVQSWISQLTSLPDVKAVEQDTVVTTY